MRPPHSLFELARYPNVYLKLTPRTSPKARNGKATPETFFPSWSPSSGVADRLGLRTIRPSEGRLPQLLAAGARSLASLPQADQDWIFAKTAQSLYPALEDK